MGVGNRTEGQVGFWFSLLCADSQEVKTFCELPPGAKEAVFDGESNIEIVRVGETRIRITSEGEVIRRATDPRRWPEDTLRFADANGVCYQLVFFDAVDEATQAVDEWNHSPGVNEFLDLVEAEEEEDDDD